MKHKAFQIPKLPASIPKKPIVGDIKQAKEINIYKLNCQLKEKFKDLESSVRKDSILGDSLND